MMAILKAAIGWISSGFLDRALTSVDKYVESTTDKERIKADVVKSYYDNRASWMQAGGFWLLMLLALPTAIHYAAVVVYSILWCKGCAYPQMWSIAGLPGVMAEWEGWIVMACIGGAGAFAWKR